MRIDSHHFSTAEHPIEHLAPILERNRFEGSVWVARAGDALDAAAHPIVHGFVVDWERRAIAHAKLRGAWFDLADGVPDGLETLARRNMALDLKLLPEHLPLAAQIAQRHSNLRIVIEDLASPPFGAPSDEWARDLETVSHIPQVFLKASGLLNGPAARPYVQFALKVFGPRRVLFGSGWPNCLPDAIWKQTLAAFTQAIGAQAMETRELLLGENARRAYDLDRSLAAGV